jgi:cell division protein FtsZ
MQTPLIPHPATGPAQADVLFTSWLQECADVPAVQALTPATKSGLLTVLQHILADTGDINVDHQDIWALLAGATSLQFGLATGEGHNRAVVVGQQLWAESTVLGEATLPAHRILLAIQSGMATELEMDELTYLLEYVVSQAGDQAEVVFGHGLNPALGESIQVMMLVSRQ